MTEVKGDAHLEQVYKDNLKYYKNDLTLKPSAVKKQKAKQVKKSGQNKKTVNGVEQNGVTERNQTSTSVAQESMEVGSTVDQIASNNGDQQDSDVSSIATVGALDQAPNKKRKPIKIKLRPTKKRKKTKKNSYEVVPDSTSENVAEDRNEEAQQNLPQQSERDSGLEGHNEQGTSEVTNQQNNGVRRSRRKKRPTKFNGLVYVAFKIKNLRYFVRPLKSLS